MNLILVIYGVMPTAQYEAIRDDLAKQYIAKGLEPPFFTNLPADYVSIEAVWIEQPEGEKVTVYNNVVNTKSDSVDGDYQAMKLMAGL